MGNFSAKPADYGEHARYFTDDEKAQLDRLYDECCEKQKRPSTFVGLRSGSLQGSQQQVSSLRELVVNHYLLCPQEPSDRGPGSVAAHRDRFYGQVFGLVGAKLGSPERWRGVYELFACLQNAGGSLRRFVELVVDAAMSAWTAPAPRASYISLVAREKDQPNYAAVLVDHLILSCPAESEGGEQGDLVREWIGKATVIATATSAMGATVSLSVDEFKSWYEENSMLQELLSLAFSWVFFGPADPSHLGSAEPRAQDGTAEKLVCGTGASATDRGPAVGDGVHTARDNQANLKKLRSKNLCVPQIVSTTSLAARRVSLLDITSAWVLSRTLPPESRQLWACLYSTNYDGVSWNAFQSAIERQGAVLLLVREKVTKGRPRVFGTYLDSDVIKSPNWSGTSNNFLFILQRYLSCCEDKSRDGTSLRQMDVFRSSGINQHYQYFNYGTRTLPNGLGVGGQMEYFGLWIDTNFHTGHSYPGATFASKQLSSSREFEIDVLEAWLVRSTDKEYDEGPARSILDTNPEAMAFLEMANRQIYSNLVRDPAGDSHNDAND
ncbi:hypothetical protein EV182_004390 [Spiromyces aspiralis]|uniref:Uncharacterized protein n=1 Tax=Spiromyces aspiralis TaxID=68401 RepID=A0ACC1HSD9_9FUNG|nr:hypothetical protein EV182_004390 [Spiromyces aspiralis]